MRVTLLVAGLLAGSGMIGCAGGEQTPAVKCESACERDQRCNLGGGSPFCRADCADRSLGLLPEFFDAFTSCYTDLDCDTGIAACEVEASSTVPRRQIDDNFQSGCQDKHGECDESFSSAYCFQSHYYEIEWIDRAILCLSMTCDAVEQCLAREMPFAPFGR
ncbi:MAG TPA: hypothetical protein VKZ63_17820 [Kofleriaceae bacterium]|nr:hypothetical protein [Kofleriaceae bacterium]